MSMPQVRIHGVDDVRVDAVERPVIGDDDALIQVSMCGICGSDLSYIAMGGVGAIRPMPLGHELSGVVAQTGANVSHVAEGDPVVVNPMACGNGIGNGGPEGAFAPFLKVRGADERAVIKVPSSLSAETAALIEPLAVAMHGCRQGRVAASDKAVIFGAGPIGLCAVINLRHLGLRDVVVVDLSEFRLRIAEKLGAVPFKADDGDLSEFLIERHGRADVMGMPAPGSDVFFEATGAAAVFEQIVGGAKTGARVVVLGVHKQPAQLDLLSLLMRELVVVGSMAYPDEFPDVIDMLRGGEVDVEPLISHRFPLSQFDRALAQARDSGGAAKVLVDCQR